MIKQKNKALLQPIVISIFFRFLYKLVKFFTVVHVTQDWKVDERGDFLEEINTVEVTHGPNKDNSWECAICGEYAVVED